MIVFELLPYESIDEEEYNRKRKSIMKPFVPSLISKVLKRTNFTK